MTRRSYLCCQSNCRRSSRHQ